MRRFYFHIRNGPAYSPDKQGWELEGLDQARELATLAVVEMARLSLPGALANEMFIEVNEHGKEPALRVNLRFEVERLAPEEPPVLAATPDGVEAANAPSLSG